MFYKFLVETADVIGISGVILLLVALFFIKHQ